MGRFSRKLLRWNSNLVAVFITISDNNKKIEIQRQSEKEQLAEQKKYAVRPYLDTRYMFFNEESKIGINDRVFDLKAGMVEKVDIILHQQISSV